jgi:hypothetical protein
MFDDDEIIRTAGWAAGDQLLQVSEIRVVTTTAVLPKLYQPVPRVRMHGAYVNTPYDFMT